MKRDSIPAEEILSRATAIGHYYGFTPLSTLTAKVRGTRRVKKEYPESLTTLGSDPTAETIIHLLKQCNDAGCVPTARQPLFVWHTNITPGRPTPKKAIVQFHALGTDRPIADAVVIRAMLALSRDLFHDEPLVRVNSMGDKETRARYAREVGVFFKRHADRLSEECLQSAKRDVFEGVQLALREECAEEMPVPTEHLSDMSRKRFEDLLEYLETTETPYELARNLLSRGTIWNDICFEIVVGSDRVAWGSHYSELARQIFSSAMPATGVVIQVASTGLVATNARQTQSRFSFVHIGDEAKRLSIRLAENFRKARIPLAQDIGVESLTEQLFLAERRGSPYVLIMGRKEALEQSTILRNQKTQEEIVLPLAGLTERLKSFV